MFNKLIVTKESKLIVPLTEDEIGKLESDGKRLDEEQLLDSLIPSDKEMLLAEVEIQTITILMEVGLV